MSKFLVMTTTLGLLFGGLASAQERLAPLSEDKPIVFITASGPGSGQDTMARTYIEIAKTYSDQLFVVENRTGGSALIAANHLRSQPADGLTVLGWTRTQVINHLTVDDAKPLAEEVHFVGILMFAPLILYTHEESAPYEDGEELISACRENPGQERWGGAYAGGVDWLMARSVWTAIDCEIQFVPFEDGSTLATAVMGKHVAVGAGDMGDIIGKEDLLRPLIISSPSRDPRLPDVPTLAELGYNVDERNHRGIVIMQDSPQEAKDFHERLLQLVVSDPRWADYLNNATASIGDATSTEMSAIVEAASRDAIQVFREEGLIKN